MEFECNVCFKRFTRKDNLERHKRSVHTDVQFSCDICHKTFNRKDAYVRHERSCSLICKYCDRVCHHQNELTEHTKSQHMDKKYMCSRCGKKYAQTTDLKKHSQKCSQTVSDFTLQPIINHIRNGVKGIRQFNFHYIFYGLDYINIELHYLWYIYQNRSIKFICSESGGT